MLNPPKASYPDLAGRTVLVTGGATGIGASLVAHFVGQGARVGFLDLDKDAGRALAASLAYATRPPLFLAVDLTDTDALRAAVQNVRDALGPITVLLNNAANDKRAGWELMTPEAWDAALAVNLRHQFFVTQAVVPDMRAAGGGSIINFGSTSWMLKQGGMPAYVTSKAAIQGLTRGLARDLGRFRIRVNTLVPGWVMTEKQLRLWVDDAARAEIARGQCIPDALQPEHIAQLALYLASDCSAMCTAQDFIVDGGWA